MSALVITCKRFLDCIGSNPVTKPTSLRDGHRTLAAPVSKMYRRVPLKQKSLLGHAISHPYLLKWVRGLLHMSWRANCIRHTHE